MSGYYGTGGTSAWKPPCEKEGAASRLVSIFSDETERFRTPAEPEAGDLVSVRIRVECEGDARVQLYCGKASRLMLPARRQGSFVYYETQITCGEEQVSYFFLLECGGMRVLYDKLGARSLAVRELPVSEQPFRFVPGFHVPAWAKGAVQYQIFTDRFRNGSAENDPVAGEYYYTDGPILRETDWYAPPGAADYRRFYGGDLQGVLEKLDYLQWLGVEAIYFNPLFVSPSSHKYDAQDYEHIDPHFGVIAEDGGACLPEGERKNSMAERYIRRVTSERNLAETDALFARLCEEMHRRGMRVILDGVFNHCGSFSRWMNREGIYPAGGAYGDPDSEYRDFFRFQDDGYEAWWGVDTLPKLNYDGSPALWERVLALGEKWARPPYSIDGWRLDVAADLAHMPEVNHRFWQEFRRRVKAVNPDILILAEHYGDPTPWLGGNEWDTVMNYDAFMEPVTWFLTGMEKHSDGRNDSLYHSGSAFFAMMRRNMARLPMPSLECAMNELSNHDHSRFLTRTNRVVGRLPSHGSSAAGQGIDKRVMREAVVIQMTWPGAPTIYYADEAGQVGWTDPDNRRTFPWGYEDVSLIELHHTLTDLRRAFPVLRAGSLTPLGAGEGWIAYARFDDTSRAVVIVNTSETGLRTQLRVRDAGAEDGDAFTLRFRTTADGFFAEPEDAGRTYNGMLTAELPAHTAVILTG